MSKEIRIFKSFEEQEIFFLKYFADLTPSERLQALAKMQKQNYKYSDAKPAKKITILKHFVYGY
jgi:hypothetical protein